MSRDTGQITTRQAFAGAAVLIIAVAGVIAGLEMLLRPGEQLPGLEAPAGREAGAPCPDPDLGRTEAVAVTADRLIECPDSYDGQRVTYRGEAVRAVLSQGDRAWLHVNDDPYALDLGPLPTHRTAVGGNSGIPVSVPRGVAEQISHVGDYRAHGDILTVTGVFRRADPRDGGGPTIQADAAQIQRAGAPTTVPLDRPRLVTATVLAVLAAGSVLAARRGAVERPLRSQQR